MCLPTDANPAIAVHKKLARIYILRAENSRAADIVMRWCFNFLLQLAGRKYYNFKLDYNLPPWSVSYVVGNNVSKSRSSIRKNNILSVPGRGCEWLWAEFYFFVSVIYSPVIERQSTPTVNSKVLLSGHNYIDNHHHHPILTRPKNQVISTSNEQQHMITHITSHITHKWLNKNTLCRSVAYTLIAYIRIRRGSGSQVLLINCTWLIDHQHMHLYKSRCFGSLLVWSTQVCINMMPRRKDIGNCLREAIVVDKGYKTIYKQCRVHQSTVRKITTLKIKDSCQSFQESTSQQVHPKIRPCNAQRNRKKHPRVTTHTLQASVSMFIFFQRFFWALVAFIWH